jgi:hypothetical protein
LQWYMKGCRQASPHNETGADWPEPSVMHLVPCTSDGGLFKTSLVTFKLHRQCDTDYDTYSKRCCSYRLKHCRFAARPPPRLHVRSQVSALSCRQVACRKTGSRTGSRTKDVHGCKHVVDGDQTNWWQALQGGDKKGSHFITIKLGDEKNVTALRTILQPARRYELWGDTHRAQHVWSRHGIRRQRKNHYYKQRKQPHDDHHDHGRWIRLRDTTFPQGYQGSVSTVDGRIVVVASG